MIPVNVNKISYHSKSRSYAVILKEIEGTRCLPVVIGSFEAQSIALAIESVETPRPLTHDLICDFILAMDVSLKSVNINTLNDGVYFSEIKFDSDGTGEQNLDARPSDAIAVALRMQIPIFVSKKVFDQSSVDENTLLKEKHNRNKDIMKISILKLKKKLDIAIEKEKYELAAILRDKINKLED